MEIFCRAIYSQALITPYDLTETAVHRGTWDWAAVVLMEPPARLSQHQPFRGQKKKADGRLIRFEKYRKIVEKIAVRRRHVVPK